MRILVVRLAWVEWIINRSNWNKWGPANAGLFLYLWGSLGPKKETGR